MVYATNEKAMQALVGRYCGGDDHQAYKSVNFRCYFHRDRGKMIEPEDSPILVANKLLSKKHSGAMPQINFYC